MMHLTVLSLVIITDKALSSYQEKDTVPPNKQTAEEAEESAVLVHHNLLSNFAQKDASSTLF